MERSEVSDDPVRFGPSDEFLRRFPKNPSHLKPDGSVSSAVFENTPGTVRMSVNWMAKSSVEDTLKGFPNFGVVMLTAEDYWKERHAIEHTPVTDPPNPAHCDIVGDKPLSVRRRLARAVRGILFSSD